MSKSTGSRAFSCRGQSLSEYGLIGALVAIATVGALLLLGGNVSQIFTGMLPGPANTANVTATTTPIAGTANSAALAGPHITLSSGTVISLPNYPTNGFDSITTAGANGTSELLAATLKDLSSQLLAAGEITPAQASLLTELSNQGHTMAEIERLLETTGRSAGTDRETFLVTPLTFQGQVYSNPLVLADQISRNTQLPSGTYVAQNNQLAAFQDLYQQLVASGGIKDPQVQAIVGELVTQVDAIAESTKVFTYRVQNSGFLPADITWLVAGDVGSSIPGSMASHGYSAGICEAGAATDSGTQCQGQSTP